MLLYLSNDRLDPELQHSIEMHPLLVHATLYSVRHPLPLGEGRGEVLVHATLYSVRHPLPLGEGRLAHRSLGEGGGEVDTPFSLIFAQHEHHPLR